MVIAQNVGNAGNEYYFYSLGDKAIKLGSIMAVRSDAQFMDVDGDGILETLTNDSTFFGWKTCNSDSAMPFVILKLRGRQFVLDVELMKAQQPTKKRQTEMIADWRNGGRDEFSRSFKSETKNSYDKNSFYLPPVVWRDMLDLIYSGNSQTAFCMLNQYWQKNRYAGNVESGKDSKRIQTRRQPSNRVDTLYGIQGAATS